MWYRICKSFEVESGHMLSKHPGRCKFPHGHSRRIDIVLASQTLDANDMVCDFAAIKHAVGEFLERFDHSMAVNAADPLAKAMDPERVVVFEGQDPTTEVMAKAIYEFVAERIASREPIVGRDGYVYRIPAGVRIERVRVTETSSSWGEYGQ